MVLAWGHGHASAAGWCFKLLLTGGLEDLSTGGGNGANNMMMLGVLGSSAAQASHACLIRLGSVGWLARYGRAWRKQRASVACLQLLPGAQFSVRCRGAIGIPMMADWDTYRGLEDAAK